MEHVDAIYRERFKQSVPLDPAAYQEFLQSAQGFLAACGLRVTVVPTPDELRRAAGAEPHHDEVKLKRSFSLGAVGTAIVLAMAVAVWRLVVAR